MTLSIVILQGRIPHYRKALYNKLSLRYDVTVIHCGDESSNHSDGYKEIILPCKSILGFKITGQLSSRLNLLKPDIIIGMADIRWIEYLFVSFYKSYRHKWIWWGLDRGNNKFASIAKHLFYRFSPGYLFYGKNSLSWFARSIPKTACALVAQNSVAIPTSKFLEPGSGYFINVGTLNRRKRNELLIKAYDQYVQCSSDPIGLVFVGEGSERINLEDYVRRLKLTNYVKFYDPIESDSDHLVEIYARSACSISLGQAGLSILQSFGHSRCYISLKNAISGTELENIIDGFNGYLCADLNEVVARMIEITTNKENHLELCKNSFKYYHEKASMDQMLNSFTSTINLVYAGRHHVAN